MDTAETLKLIKRCEDELGAVRVQATETIRWEQGTSVGARTYEVWVTRNVHHTIILRGKSPAELNERIEREAKLLATT